MTGEPESELAQFDGKVGILVDRGNVARVRLHDLTRDGNLVCFRYETLATPGLNEACASSDLILSTTVEVLQSSTYWAAAHVGWRIYFDPAVIDRVQAIVSSLASGKTYRDDYSSRPAPPGSRFVSVQTPGPTAAALYAFLRQVDLGS
jgi:hypothetical protein